MSSLVSMRPRYGPVRAARESLPVPLTTGTPSPAIVVADSSQDPNDEEPCEQRSSTAPETSPSATGPTRPSSEPTDAVVRVVMGCVCGSDLWYYRGESDHAVGSIGHEFIGVVEDIGADVDGIRRGDLVIAPFIYSDGTCPHCQHGSTIACVARRHLRRRRHRRRPGRSRPRPARRQHPRPGPGSGHDDAMLRSLLTLSDVMSTGHHAAVSAGVAARATPSPSSATAPSASPPCSPPIASAPTGSSP